MARALVLVSVLLLLVQSTVSASEPQAVTVFVAKKIHTMDPGWPEATAVAVRGGTILDVGRLDDVKLYLR